MCFIREVCHNNRMFLPRLETKEMTLGNLFVIVIRAKVTEGSLFSGFQVVLIEFYVGVK